MVSGGLSSSQDAAARLRDVRAITDAALSNLDEESFLAELLDRVKDVFQADTAAVLLLDTASNQLIATAASGLEEEVSQGVRLPVGRGFAGRIAATRQAVIIDPVTDRNIVNPILLAKGIRSLMGVPLIAGGAVIGVLHVGSLTPRTFTSEETELLRLAADRAAAAVQSMHARTAHAAAAALQRSLVPPALPDLPGIDMAARYVPGHGHVGGDWYDVFPLPSAAMCVVIGDVAGAGLQAAVIMGRMRSALRAYSLETSDPAAILAKLDRKMQHFEPGALATVVCAVIDADLARMRISSAGHFPPVSALPGEPATPAKITTDLLIGMDAAAARHTTTLEIPPGAMFCFFTDGLVERRDEDLDQGVARLCQAISPGSVDETCASVMSVMVGSEPARDDVALLILKRSA